MKTEEDIVKRKGSTQVMADLIDLLNQYNPEKITVNFDDLIFSDPENDSFGTLIHIFIPKKYNYELS